MRGKLRFKRDCQKFSLETLVQSMSQPHKISPLHFHNIREVVNYPNQSSSIRFDSIRFSLYSTRFDSVHFFKFGIRFDSIRLNRIELFDNSIHFRSLAQYTTMNWKERETHKKLNRSINLFMTIHISFDRTG